MLETVTKPGSLEAPTQEGNLLRQAVPSLGSSGCTVRSKQKKDFKRSSTEFTDVFAETSVGLPDNHGGVSQGSASFGETITQRGQWATTASASGDVLPFFHSACPAAVLQRWQWECGRRRSDGARTSLPLRDLLLRLGSSSAPNVSLALFIYTCNTRQ